MIPEDYQHQKGKWTKLRKKNPYLLNTEPETIWCEGHTKRKQITSSYYYWYYEDGAEIKTNHPTAMYANPGSIYRTRISGAPK